MNIILVALDTNSGIIGVNNALPWDIPSDLALFKALTINSTIIMGRRTWESLPTKPLPSRQHIIISHNPDQIQLGDLSNKQLQQVSVSSDLRLVVSASDHWSHSFPQQQDRIEDVNPRGVTIATHCDVERLNQQSDSIIIGGAQIYNQALGTCRDLIDAVMITQVNAFSENEARQLITKDTTAVFDRGLLKGYDCAHVSRTYSHAGLSYNHVLYISKDTASADAALLKWKSALSKVYKSRRQSEEKQYKDLLQQINEIGDVRMTRGVDASGARLGTKSIFGTQLHFDLSTGVLPICTLRKCWAKGCIEELFWILRGSTDVADLRSRGVKVWDGNTTRAALDSYGFTERPVDDIGPSYGFQVRHAGGNYTDKTADYTGCGFDQLNALIQGLKKDPFGRRHIMSLWSPAQTQQMTLPPCTVLLHFSVSSAKALSCSIYLRSSDVTLALMSWNVPQYAVLLAIIAHHCGFTRGQLIVSIGDAHIYSNQLQALEMLNRTPMPFPQLKITADPEKSPDQYEYKDIQVTNYNSHPAINIPMAI